MPDRPAGLPVLVYGGGELGTAVAHRLHRAGFRVLVVERPEPTAVCRRISLATAVYEGLLTIEDMVGMREDGILAAEDVLDRGQVPVMVEPTAPMLARFGAELLVDATDPPAAAAELPAGVVVRLGSGRAVGMGASAVVDTGLALSLGKVFYSGGPGVGPELPEGLHPVLPVWAGATGVFVAETEIGDAVQEGGRLGTVGRYPVEAPRAGFVRGLLADGLTARDGRRVAELWLGDDASGCYAVSPWARAVAGGALEAVVRLMFKRSDWPQGRRGAAWM